MAVASTIFVSTKYAEMADTLQYLPSISTSIIDKFTVNNVSTVAVTFTAHIVTTGGSPGLDNKIVSRSIPAGQASCMAEMIGQILTTNTALYTSCSAASAIVMRVCGREITT